MKNYKNLKNAIKAEEKQRNVENAYFIKHGYLKNWSAEHKNENADGLRRYCTPLQWEKFNNGKITRTEANKKAIKRAEALNAKNASAQIAAVEAAEAFTPSKSITICVAWKKSRIWGYNPTATIYTDNGTHTGSASGCGYDKRSAAVAEALNEAPEILTALYCLQNGRRRIPYGTTAQYDKRCPACFEGGVGISSTLEVLKACGYQLITRNEPDSGTDFYYLEYIGA